MTVRQRKKQTTSVVCGMSTIPSEDRAMKTYEVEVQFTLSVQACDRDHAEEIALERLDSLNVCPERVAILSARRVEN